METKLDTVVPGSKTETTVKSTDVWHDIMPMSVHKYIRGVYNHHFYFPAQLVGGFTLSELLDKPWSQVSSRITPGMCLQFLSRIGFSNPLLVHFHRMLLTHALALSANDFVVQQKVPTSMCTR